MTCFPYIFSHLFAGQFHLTIRLSPGGSVLFLENRTELSLSVAPYGTPPEGPQVAGRRCFLFGLKGGSIKKSRIRVDENWNGGT